MDASPPTVGPLSPVPALQPATAPSQPWDGFVTGPETALAHAGVLALARGDALGVSPLILHGPSGAGKTRLLQGLVGEWLLRRPESAVAHLEAEAFAAACAEATTRREGWAELRSRFRSLDLFVLEDVHALERAPLALGELSHTLDALAESGAGVAVSARTGPGQWVGWPPRLVNRLLGGLAVRVDPPGLAARRRFLLDRAREKGSRLTADAVDALAESADGYRTLDGWLARLALTARVDRVPIDRGLVGALLDGDAGTSPVTPARIVREVAGRFGVSAREIRGATRRKSVAEPRHLAMYLVRERTGLSFQKIGALFGRRDPATVRHACKAAASRLAADPALAAAVAAMAGRWATAPAVEGD